MINKPRKPLRIGIGLFGAVMAFSFVFFACSTPAGDEQIANIEMPEIELIDEVYEVVDVMPEYPGGMDSLIAFLVKNIKYPESAKVNGIEGKVLVNFIVEKDGSIGEATVIQSVSDDCDAEALRVINAMPDWSPGQKGGENVRVSFKLPIGYNLGNGSEKKEVFKVVEQMPEFPGGTNALMKYLGSNIKYPEQAKRDSIQGKVFVQFVVGKDGSIENVHVLRGIGGGCDEEAIRVISNMPKWKPGMDNGKAVRVEYNIPINYALK